MSIKTVGFIGLGVMGHSMASHLMDAGFKLKVYNRTKAKAQDLIEKGAIWADSPKELAKDCDVVISIVGYPADVKSVWLDENGALLGMKEGAIGVDMTTSTPNLAKELAKEGSKRNVTICDAPVTGGDIGARNATLTILFGGDETAFAKLEPVFKAIGKTYVRFGTNGCGQYAKICNQIAIAAGMMSVCEALITAKKTGLDEELVLKTLSAGAAGSFSLSSYGPRILKGDFNPGFYVKHFVKDMKIALDVAKECNLQLPGLELACKLYEKLEKEGDGDLGTQALYKLYLNSQLNFVIQ